MLPAARMWAAFAAVSRCAAGGEKGVLQIEMRTIINII